MKNCYNCAHSGYDEANNLIMCGHPSKGNGYAPCSGDGCGFWQWDK